MAGLQLMEFEDVFLRDLKKASEKQRKWEIEEMGIRQKKTGDGTSQADIYHYGAGEKIRICPEPYTMMKEFKDIANDKRESHERFLAKKAEFPVIKLDDAPCLESGAPIWLNKTTAGINLRPGMCQGAGDGESVTDYQQIVMGDECVHGVTAGRTGGGKSVFLNALILSMLSEYAPWELDLYLADFKRVEFSRYMNDAHENNHNMPYTPHIKACAATGESTYVVSLLHHLADCMQARNQFFMQLGLTKLQEFRDKYDVVLPRVLLIVDEFQQMFLEIEERKKTEIQILLKMIAKLGRATGFHLLFASQEMSGTGIAGILGNFKIRIALPCDSSVASEILGSGHEIEKIDVGQVKINASRKGLVYQVPYAKAEDADETADEEDGEKKQRAEFNRYLDQIKCQAEPYREALSYKLSVQKFYREEIQETEKNYLAILESIRDGKCEYLQNSSYADAVVLGDITEHTERSQDKAVLYIEKGRNRGILIASNSDENNARMRKLLMENFMRSPRETKYISLEMNPMVAKYYDVEKAVANFHSRRGQLQSAVKVGEENIFFQHMRYSYKLRRSAEEYFEAERNAEEREKAADAWKRLEEAWEDEEKRQETAAFEEKREEVKAELPSHKENVMRSLLRFLNSINERKGVLSAKNPDLPVNYAELPQYEAILQTGCPEKSIEAYLEEAAEETRSAKEKANLELRKAQGSRREDEAAVWSLRIAKCVILRQAILFFRAKYIGEERPANAPYQDVFADALKEDGDFPGCAQWYRDYLFEPEAYRLLKETEKHAQEYVNYIFQSVGNSYTAPEIVLQKEALDQGLPAFRCPKKKILKESLGTSMDHLFEDGLKEAMIMYGYYIYNSGFGRSAYAFPRLVYCINGLDFLESVPSDISEIIKGSGGAAMQVIAMITNDQALPVRSGCFDYNFVMGNVKGYYNRLGVPYTLKEADSFVVTLYIRSKDRTIPFKLYSSEMEAIEEPSVIEDLLEENARWRKEWSRRREMR